MTFALPASIRAAVVRRPETGFEIETVELGLPRDNEVVVRIVAVGLCHTDLVARDQLFPIPQPIVLGHEGAGIVEAVGARVTKVAPGDHVVLTFMSCGQCRTCRMGVPANCENFNALNFSGARPDGSHALCGHAGGEMNDRFFGQSSFAAVSIADERNVVKVRKDADLRYLGPLGCGIQTGAGAVLNALKVSAGASFAAFGAGAVGLSAIMAARVAGATTIVAVDVVPSRLDLALELGATHVINSRQQDPVEAIRALTDKGVEFALDSTGIPGVIAQAVSSLRMKGSCAIVGAAAMDAKIELNMMDVMQNCKVLRGVVEGDGNPDLFIPVLVDLFMQGRFPIDRLIEFYKIEQINEAAHESEAGSVIKPVIVF